jgi:hypothetical protein
MSRDIILIAIVVLRGIFCIVFVMYQLNEEGAGRSHIDAGKPESNIPHSRISRDLLMEQDQSI